MTGDSFNDLLKQVSACRVCIEIPRGAPLPHQPRPVVFGRPTARILIAGQAPGVRVHNSGIPFTDPSGVRLRQWMAVDEATFYNQDKVAIVPMGFCFPGLNDKGGDLPPRRECAPLWRDGIMAGLTELRLVLVIGQYAQAWHLGADRRASLTKTVAAWRDYAYAADPMKLPLPHPSWRNNGWIKKNPWFEADLLPVLQREVERALR